MEKSDIMSLTLDELETEIQALKEPGFRAKQIYQWMHQQLAEDFDQMTNLPKKLREKLSERGKILIPDLVDMKKSKDGGTAKFLFRLHDGSIIESVLMKYKHGNSVCISSQVGCRMGCSFCASALGGWERNLMPSEMLGQIYKIQRLSGERVSNVVVMGTGEPLDNYDHLIRFIELLSDENGLHISKRNVTVSTCGLVPEIIKLAKEKLPITLAISLHAPNDEIRRKIMPIANKYTISEIMDACYYYYESTGRRITFEYSLMEGVNDSRENAEQLAQLLKGFNCHVNLIPVNPIKERNYRHSDMEFIQNFKNILEKYRINVTIRREMGTDIDAACGQLRKSYMDAKKQIRR